MNSDKAGLPPRPPDDAPPQAWKKYAEEMEAVAAAGEQRANFLHARLNALITSPAWKLLRKARGLLPAWAGGTPSARARRIVPSPAHVPRIDGEPLVSILIPFRDQAKVLARCLDSLRTRTAYRHFEIVLIDNGSRERAANRMVESEGRKAGVKTLRIDEPFNFARLINAGSSVAEGEHLLLLNNDTEALDSGWLGALLELIQRADVGAVGAKLLFPDGRIQHAGVEMGMDDVCGHVFRLASGDDPRAAEVRECAAVTGACLMTRKALFDECGGLDEAHLPVCYNDIDYCLRLREKGYRTLYTPRARLIHHESLSRGQANDPSEAAYMCRRWAGAIQNSKFKIQN